MRKEKFENSVNRYAMRVRYMANLGKMYGYVLPREFRPKEEHWMEARLTDGAKLDLFVFVQKSNDEVVVARYHIPLYRTTRRHILVLTGLLDPEEEEILGL